MDIQILPYHEKDQAGIDIMMAEIAAEFTSPISPAVGKTIRKIPDKYWVACYGRQVVGTIGIIPVGKEFAILKSMMVKKAFRGKHFGISGSLMNTAINWCIENDLPQVYLGTMNQFTRAQQFYEKNGFERIARNNLPSAFLLNPLDKVFYRRSL